MFSWEKMSVEKNKIFRRVPDFYDGKSLLITGANGFVGIVLTEALLRCCLGIRAIYIVVRPKKGKAPEERLEEMLKKRIFDVLKDQNPDALKKLHLITGEVTQSNLGMSSDYLKKVCEEVSIVFHCAASISFTKPLRFLIVNNVLGTQNVIDLCKKLKNMEMLVYTSTQVSNCNRTGIVIKERVYRLPYPAHNFLDALKKEDDAELNMLYNQCKPAWPNYYTFSKCLAENLIQDEASDMNCVIVRPSIVASVWKEPLPGFMEENSSLAQLCVGTGKGFIKVILGNPKLLMDFIPVDVVANAHIVAAWHLASKKSSPPLVVNCTSYGSDQDTLEGFLKNMSDFSSDFLLPNSFRSFTAVTVVDSKLKYRLATLYEHYIPAYFLDSFLRLSGRKPRLVPLYKFYDNASFTAYPFLISNWDYEIKNLHSLQELDPEDSKLFYTNLTGFNIKEAAYNLPKGAEMFNWSQDKKSEEERKRIIKHRHYLSKGIQYAVLFFLFCVLYKLFTFYLNN